MQKNLINELRHSSRKLIRELGLLELDKAHLNRTPQHWHALIEIHNEPDITITKLGSLLLLTYSTISRIVRSLVKEGLVASTEGIDKRENYLHLTKNGVLAVKHIDQFSNTKILGALEFLTESDLNQIIETFQKYSTALEKSRVLREQIKIHTLSTSRAIRKQIINLIENIQKNEFSLPITDKINNGILKAESEFYYSNSYNFWYAVDGTGQIIGSIALKKIDNQTGEIKKFFVHREFRNKGVAQKLIHILAKTALKHNFNYLYLGTADVLKAAQRFYAKYGFTSISKSDLPMGFNICPLDNVFYKVNSQELLKNIDHY